MRKSCVIQLSSVSIRYQFSSSRCSSQLRGVRGSITCFVTREGGTSSKLKQSLVSRIVICTVLAFSKIMRRSRVQQGKCAHPMLLSRQFNGRLSPRTCHDLQPSLPQTLLKPVWNPEKRMAAVCKRVCNATFFEHKHPMAFCEGHLDFALLCPKSSTATAPASTAKMPPPPAVLRGIAQQSSSNSLTTVGNSA